MLIVQVSTSRDDFFREIDESRLKEIASRIKPGEDYDMSVLDRMREDFWSSSKEARIYRSSEAEYALVLDGSSDHESWQEILESDEDPDIYSLNPRHGCRLRALARTEGRRSRWRRRKSSA